MEKDDGQTKKDDLESSEDKTEEEPKQESLDDILNEEDSKKETSKKQNSQLRWIIFLMVAVIVIILLVPFIMKEANEFEYIGLEFQKTKLGEISFYSTRFPVVNIQGAIIGDYSINFRSDPRELEDISVDVQDKKIKFLRNHRGTYNTVYIAIDPDMEVCADAGIAMLNLVGFLRDSNLDVQSAVTNQSYAEANDVKYANCLQNPANTIIRLQSGNQTRIYQTLNNCYNIVYKDCDIIPATERFVLAMLEEYMSHFREVGTDEPVVKDRENSEKDDGQDYFNIDLEEEVEQDTEEENSETVQEETVEEDPGEDFVGEELPDLLGIEPVF